MKLSVLGCPRFAPPGVRSRTFRFRGTSEYAWLRGISSYLSTMMLSLSRNGSLSLLNHMPTLQSVLSAVWSLTTQDTIFTTNTVLSTVSEMPTCLCLDQHLTYVFPRATDSLIYWDATHHSVDPLCWILVDLTRNT